MVVEGDVAHKRLAFRVERKLRTRTRHLASRCRDQTSPGSRRSRRSRRHLRLRFQVFAEVPFADSLGEVARLAQQAGDGGLVVQDTCFAGKAGPQCACAHGQPPGQQRAARRRARGLRVGREQLQPFTSPARSMLGVGAPPSSRRRRCLARPTQCCPSGRSKCSVSCRCAVPAPPAFACATAAWSSCGSPLPCSLAIFTVRRRQRVGGVRPLPCAAEDPRPASPATPPLLRPRLSAATGAGTAALSAPQPPHSPAILTKSRRDNSMSSSSPLWKNFVEITLHADKRPGALRVHAHQRVGALQIVVFTLGVVVDDHQVEEGAFAAAVYCNISMSPSELPAATSSSQSSSLASSSRSPCGDANGRAQIDAGRRVGGGEQGARLPVAASYRTSASCARLLRDVSQLRAGRTPRKAAGRRPHQRAGLDDTSAV